MHVQVRHGKGTSGVTGYDHGRDTQVFPTTRPRLTGVVMKRSDSLCVDVVNAHPVFYSYSVDVTVDTARERLPDFSAVIGALNPLLQAASRKASSARTAGTPMQVPEWVATFDTLFQPLENAIVTAQVAVRASDTAANGIQHAIAGVTAIPDVPTATDLQRWFDAIRLGGSPTDTLLRSALKSYGETLIAARAALKSTYASASAAVTRCAALGERKTTIRLRVKRQVAIAARDSGVIAEIVATPQYERAHVEAFPMLLTGFVRDVTTFSLQSDTIRETLREDSRLYRPGAAVLVNLPGSGEAAYGMAVGFGLTSEQKIALSDLLFAFVFSYKNLIRVGIGAGSSEVPIGLKPPARVGAPLQNADDLEKLIVRGDKRAWYLLIAIPGLSVESPWP